MLIYNLIGKIYSAISPEGTILALKKQHVTKHVARPMLRHEACAMIILEGHPSMPSVDAWARSQYYEYITMELLGPALADVTEEGKSDIGDSISYVHIIHSDIKPANFIFGIGEHST